MGQILNGIYTRGKPDMAQLQSRQQSTWRRWSHKTQRQDYASEVVQPRNRDGSPNEAFIENYPEEAVDYGFVPSQAEIMGNDSGTEVIPDQGAQIVNADDIQLQAELPNMEDMTWAN